MKGNRRDGGSGRQGGEVEGPEAVSGCLAASEERGGFRGGVDGNGAVGKNSGAVGADKGGDGEEAVEEVGVRADEAGDRVGMVGKTEGASGGSPKDRAVGDVTAERQPYYLSCSIHMFSVTVRTVL